MHDLTAELDDIKRRLAIEFDRGRQLEEAVRRYQEQLSSAKEVMHDISNHLLIMYFSGKELLSSLAIDDSKRSAVVAIEEARNEIVDLAREFRNSLMDFTPLTTSTDLNQIISYTESIFRDVIKPDTILRVILTGTTTRIGVPAWQIERILFHLLLNAMSRLPDGGWITIESTQLDPTAADENTQAGSSPERWVRVSVSDTGSIDGGQRRSSPAILGLSAPGEMQSRGGIDVVENLVRQLGGKIEVSSSAESGTVVELQFLMSEPQQQTSALPARPHLVGRSQTVLVVEDEPLLRKFVKSSLESRGFHVIDAANGNSAIAASVGHSTHLDLVIADVKLLDMSGFEVVAKLQTMHPRLRAVMMSGMMSDELNYQKISREAVSFLPKPFQTGDLIKSVQESLGKSVRAS